MPSNLLGPLPRCNSLISSNHAVEENWSHPHFTDVEAEGRPVLYLPKITLKGANLNMPMQCNWHAGVANPA